MNLKHLHRRLDRLDATAPREPRRLILMQHDDGETFEIAVERWCAQNPGEPPPDDKTDFVILRAIVGPEPK